MEDSDRGLHGSIVFGLEDEGKSHVFSDGTRVVSMRPSSFGEDGGLVGAIPTGSLIQMDATDDVMVITLADGGGKGCMEHIQ